MYVRAFVFLSSPSAFSGSQGTMAHSQAAQQPQQQTNGDNAAWLTSGPATDSTWGGGEEDESMEDEERDTLDEDLDEEEAEENWQLNSGAVARQAAVVSVDKKERSSLLYVCGYTYTIHGVTSLGALWPAYLRRA